MKTRNSSKTAGIFLLLFTAICIFVTFAFIPPIPQWNSYHQFADTRSVANIPNFGDVMSNVLFFVVGIMGLFVLKNQWNNKNLTGKEATVFFFLLAGVFLVGAGSAFYHWSPDNTSLVWDRIPMAIVFMSLLSLTIMERVNVKLGFWLLFPLVAIGIFSVLYWHWTEAIGKGDLRLYGLVEFYSMVLIIGILCFFPKAYPPVKLYIWMFILYGFAKLFEQSDLMIYGWGNIISGHTLKHIFSAMSTYCIVLMLHRKGIVRAYA
jgi:hypothetical protein